MGPPTGNRYAPFVEEEWDDSTTMIPGEETREETTNGINDKAKVDTPFTPFFPLPFLESCNRNIKVRIGI